MFRGPAILVRTLTAPVATGATGDLWQYHPRSDRHSKIACWGLLFDLLHCCDALRAHVASGKVGFGINHEMRDFEQNRRKNLDLVVCTPGSGAQTSRKTSGFRSLVARWGVILDPDEVARLASLPDVAETPVGSVRVAMEAKACMTEHMKARPRLYDELNSSQQTIRGAVEDAIAAGLVLVNAAPEFISPTRPGGVRNAHRQPESAAKVIEKIKELPRRSGTNKAGFDAIAVQVIECRNDGSPASLVVTEPAPQPQDIFHYDSAVLRLAQVYQARFGSAF